ncbi:MAG: gamma-glutamyltransferase [Proteobacteria bacterium]|nr:gamma-glutamyltransferase [Pseudomonadota bacterium]
MSSGNWRQRAGTEFECEKRPASGARGMVVTNHPLASAAGAEMLAAGGNAVDAAIAALFTLSVVEPMMVGIFGGGMAHIRLADGRHLVLDGQSSAPLAARADSYRPVSDTWPNYMETEGRENALGARAIAVPGNLMGWCEALQRYGTFELATVIEPAIRHAAQGFRATPFLCECIDDAAADLVKDKTIAGLLLPGGRPLQAGDRLMQSAYADTLRTIARDGPDALYKGALGIQIADSLQRMGSLLALEDLRRYRTIERAPVRGFYRGFEIIGPPPPSSSGVHIVEMLNILEAYDIAGIGFGTQAGIHLILECLKIAFADRAAATGDPDFLDVPVDRLMSKAYAASRRQEIDTARAGSFGAGALAKESANTTHLTVADGEGIIVCTTQTINSTFGARIMVPGTGIIPNNYMFLFDPHPGHAQSIVAGKRVTTSMSPMIVLKEGRPHFALGMPGGLRIFGSVMQALVNLIDHRMSLQEAVEAPRVWTQGQAAELESKVPDAVLEGLRRLGHDVLPVPHVGGGMCAIQFEETGAMTGAACWRADGHAIGLGGGLARPGARFWPDHKRG